MPAHARMSFASNNLTPPASPIPNEQMSTTTLDTPAAENIATTTVTVQPSPRAFLRALQAANARAAGSHTKSFKLANAVIWALITFLILWVGTGLSPLAIPESLRAWSPVLLFALWMAAGLWQRRRTYRRLLKAQNLPYQLSIEPDGVRTRSARGETLMRWQILEAIEVVGDAVHFHFNGYQVLWVEASCFGSHDEFEAFVAQAEAFSGVKRGKAAAQAPAAPAEKGIHPLQALLGNVLAGVLAFALRPSFRARLHGTTGQFVALIALSAIAVVVLDRFRIDGPALFNAWAIPAVLFVFPLMLLAAWSTTRAEGLAQSTYRIVGAAVSLAGIWFAMIMLVALLHFAWPLLGKNLANWLALAQFAVYLWGLLAMVVALCRSLDLLPESRVAAMLAVLLLIYAPLTVTSMESRTRLWMKDYRQDDASASASAERWEKPVREAVLYAQADLLEKAMEGVQAGREGVPEVFLLAVAGHGDQDVFKREVDSVSALFAERFDAKGHTLALTNNPETALETPMATVTALKRSLKAIAQKMNAEEDVLFLFLTSHGSENHRFDLSLYPYKLDELTPAVLKQAIADAGIRYRVIVISACYSGGFVLPLADPNALVMSAARADRNSHGCSHEADWTFFGRAYFDEALKKTTSFRKAFDLATVKISEREKAESLLASEPQIKEGAEIAPVLAKLEQYWASLAAKSETAK